LKKAPEINGILNHLAGTIKDGYICGRGTTDDKINLISILEVQKNY
jgi:acetylornithine deacetylase/succinyl-diaminopimelate desuccinylase-like protein